MFHEDLDLKDVALPRGLHFLVEPSTTPRGDPMRNGLNYFKTYKYKSSSRHIL